MSRYSKFKMAYSTSTGFMGFIFHTGYQGLLMPVWFRKLFARTAIHKTWLSGFYGGGVMKVLERHKDTSEQLNY
jgi:hypothetical protein